MHNLLGRMGRRAGVVILLVVVAAGLVRPAVAEPALWRAERGEATVYVLGTIHLLTPEVEWYGGALAEAFEAADTLTLELAPEQLDPAVMAGIIQQKAFYPPGDGLSAHLSDETYGEVVERGQAGGLPPQAIERFRPWYVAIVLAVQIAQVEGFLPEYGVDRLLSEKAAIAGKPIGGLETAAEQLGLLADHPEDIQVAMLKDTLRQLEDLPAFFEALSSAWVSGTVDELEASLLASLESVPELYDAVIVGRNRSWVPKIEALLDQPGTHFVAVGAGHLLGKDSVIEMLRAQGVVIERQ